VEQASTLTITPPMQLGDSQYNNINNTVLIIDYAKIVARVEDIVHKSQGSVLMSSTLATIFASSMINITLLYKYISEVLNH
jgi:hypothetical protein